MTTHALLKICVACAAWCVCCCMAARGEGSAPSATAAPAAKEEPLDSLMKGITAGGVVGVVVIGFKLIKALGEMKTVINGVVDDRIKIREQEKKEGALPQPLVTMRDNPPVGKREFDAHRERNTTAHSELFEKQRALEQKLREEIQAANSSLLEKLETEIRDLREADKHNCEAIGAKIERLIESIGELQGRIASGRTGK